MHGKKNFLIILLGTWLFVSTLAITAVIFKNPALRAASMMEWGVIIFWIIICGGLMYHFREPVRGVILKIRLPSQFKFVIFAVSLALLEEAITTAMTNLAPLFGAKIGEAYITASANFFDVVFFHSAINFVGPFIFWAFALKRYDFSPFAAFLIFGISGTLAEASFGGFEHLLEFGLWIFVYGLMIFLPVYSLPDAEKRGAIKPRWYHYVAMVFLPALFVPLFSWIPGVVDPNHAQPTHFPPLNIR
ncbi:MAG: Membrane protein [Parcubacteria group bacterium LiPW_15]|nr:MAG: Membrane protein [Parcubacteria group bacterium LiPW_15]